ncbi:MAG: deoxyribodipyrimidine photo-lyase [Rhizobiaceae bacterium]
MASRTASKPVIVLFRNDLRVADNGALAAGADSGRPVIPLFVLDETAGRARGAASRWWLHHSLEALGARLKALGAPLALRRGDTDSIVADVRKASGAGAVFWNRRYEPGCAAADSRLKARLNDEGIEAESFDGALLHEPSRVKTGSGGFYRVYTPFRRALAGGLDPRDPIDAPERLTPWGGHLDGEPLDRFGLLPEKPDWAGGLRQRWTPGEEGARARLEAFLTHDLDDYARGRDFPGMEGTTRLSPHLAHGEITPFQILARLSRLRASRHEAGADKLRREIVWREFSYHLLFHRPALHTENFREEFLRFPWRRDEAGLRAWRRGLTGYPIVDAGMRELWRTGWMHNRVRMIAASFLVKDLMIDWRDGEGWFWDTLVDADPADNPMNWQWVAGTGADAAPYFRIFNPVLQGERFDPDGDYVRRYVPELKALPGRWLHRPWEAPKAALDEAGVTLGETYPLPILRHDEARDRSLAAYRQMRRS